MDDEYFEELDHQDIERIEEDDEAPIGPDEAEEAVVTTRDVKPKRIIIKPRLKLDDKRLKGPRGLSVLEPLFQNVKLLGPGYERKDLDTVMALLEHWAHRLFPKMTFDDCLEKIEDLGHKKSVSSYVTLLRMGAADEPVEIVNEGPVTSPPQSSEPTVDPFDQLLDRPAQSQLTQEQRERMERNKLLALERRRAKLKAKYEKANITTEQNSSSLLMGVSVHSDNSVTASEDTIVLAENSVISNGNPISDFIGESRETVTEKNYSVTKSGISNVNTEAFSESNNENLISLEMTESTSNNDRVSEAVDEPMEITTNNENESQLNLSTTNLTDTENL